jgi:Phosphopantetheine attachment site
MKAPTIDSSDLVELIMLLEDVFEVEIANEEAEAFGSPRELIDLLERHLSFKRPGKEAIKILSGIADRQNRPELVQDVEGLWRREQIAAIVRTIFRSLGE